MKFILTEPKKDDPIFKQGFVISRTKLQKIDLVKVPKNMSREEKIKYLTKSLIKLGWQYTGDK